MVAARTLVASTSIMKRLREALHDRIQVTYEQACPIGHSGMRPLLFELKQA